MSEPRAKRPVHVFYVDQPVKCVECGRTTKRRSLRQIYCGERCGLKARQRAYRGRRALKKNAPKRPVDLVGRSSRRWRVSVRLSPDLRRAILDAEIGRSPQANVPARVGARNRDEIQILPTAKSEGPRTR